MPTFFTSKFDIGESVAFNYRPSDVFTVVGITFQGPGRCEYALASINKGKIVVFYEYEVKLVSVSGEVKSE